MPRRANTCLSDLCSRRLATNHARTLATVGLVAPQWLDGISLASERDRLETPPGTVVGILACRRVVPTILKTREVAGVSHRLCVLVASGDAVAIKEPVAERLILHVHRVRATG